MEHNDHVTESWDNGTGLAGTIWHAPNPRGNVLLQHGFAEYSKRYVTQYAHLIPKLNEAGLSVYANDLHGHGESPGKRRDVDLLKSIDSHLLARESIGTELPLFLFGHSLGGAVTAGSIMRNQRNVLGAVLSGPALIRLPSGLSAMLGKAGHRWPMLPIKGLAPNAMTQSKAILAAVNDDPMMCRGWMPLGLIGSLCIANDALWQHVDQWHVPILLVHGSRDKYTQPRDSKRFVQRIGTTDKALNIVEGGFHETYNDPGGEILADQTVQWMLQRL